MAKDGLDFYVSRIEDLCCSFKQSMCADHLPYPAIQIFNRYLDKVIDDYESCNNPSSLLYCLDLLNDLYIHNNPNFLFDLKLADLDSIDNLDDFKDLEQPIYAQTLKYHKTHMSSEKLRVYSDYLNTVYKHISQRLDNLGISLAEDFIANVKLKAGVSIAQIKNVINLLQSHGYIDNDADTSKAFLSLFEGASLAQQKMKIQWKFTSKTAGRRNEPVQNIAALYILFDTIGVDLKSKSNRAIIEKVFLDGGSMKPRTKSNLLRDFESQIKKALNNE